ncbi:MAG: hypothetical protein ACT4P6_13080 [Gemmatimonadaceae bacterium]
MAAKRPTRSSAATARVILRTRSAEFTIPWPRTTGARLAELQRTAIEWSNILRSRRRWAPNDKTKDDQVTRAGQYLTRTLGLSERDRHVLAESPWIEVVLPFTQEEHAWETRILPWEYILSAGTREIRTAPMVVRRTLDGVAQTREVPTKPKVLYVESAPGVIADSFDFKEERRLVKISTNPKEFVKLKSPTRAELTAALKAGPHIVHLAGADNHQGLALVRDPSVDQARDGYILAGSNSTLDPVDAFDLARLFTAHPPALVFCNFWNSAARTAAMLVAIGKVGTAIGFQDAFTDGHSEIFLASFYEALSGGVPINEAFELAWESLRGKPRLHGTGIALWRGKAASAATRTRATARRKMAAQAEREEEPSVLSPDAIASEQLRDVFSITVTPFEEINYSLLHNKRDLFSKFSIRNLRRERIDGVSVRVELNVGDDAPYPFRQSFSVTRAQPLDLAPVVCVALTSSAHRTVDEVTKTSLFVEVRWGKHELFSQTFATILAPIDQWTDTDRDRLFLPSFVFPRDAAVNKVLEAAQLYVPALRDDPTAGFDGYQALIASLEDEPEVDVDNQVQAIWYAITHRVPVVYNNPPASYPPSGESQRVRTPTEVVATGRGTCIDLALLMASCLEAVEIYPVLFLFTEHAFPGYWRTDSAYEAFHKRITELATTESRAWSVKEAPGQDHDSNLAASREGQTGWYLENKYLAEIRKEVKANRLVPLETVGLTKRSSWQNAIKEATPWFDETASFDSMIDIHKARDLHITPLPISSRVRL